MIPLLLAPALLLAVPDARAGTLYINGVRMDAAPEVRLERCTVRIDVSGNIFIDAPGYRPSESTASTADRGPVAVRLDPVRGVVSDPVPAVPPEGVVAALAPVRPAVAPAVAEPARAAPSARWWLVTEDQESTGQAVEVRINGTVVRTLRSSSVQVLLDVGPWLRLGANTVEFVPLAGSGAGGGALAAWIGSGIPVNGTLRLDAPEVRWVLGAGDAGGVQRFALTVR